MAVRQYKCPNCSGAVKFDSSLQMMKCPFCQAEFDPAVFNVPQGEAEEPDLGGVGFNAAKLNSWDEADRADLCAGGCPSCGAEFFGCDNTVATVCPCCDNAQIIVKRLSDGFRPDCIIPFKLEKKDAVAAMKEFYRGKRLLPGCFADGNHVEEVKGIYAPFWLFDAGVEGTVKYSASMPGGGKNRTPIPLDLTCEGSLDFDKVPVDASEKLDDAYMDAIEPFHYSGMVDFDKSFLAGYAAEKYDVGADRCRVRAENRMENTLRKEFKKLAKEALTERSSGYVGYGSIKSEDSSDIKIKNSKASYGLLPVWILNTKYKGSNYRFMMNGQTGHLVGRLPVDKSKALKYSSALIGIPGIILMILALILSAADLSPAALVIPPVLGILAASVVWWPAIRAWIDEKIGPGAWVVALVFGVFGVIFCTIACSIMYANGFMQKLIESSLLLPFAIVISWAASVAAGNGVMYKWKRQMDNAREKTLACGYAVWSSFKSNVTKKRK